MTQYEATLIVGADPNPIATTVALDGANLELAAAGQSLGKWPIADLGLERIFGGYRMNVEGESAILKLTDPEQFAEAIEIATGAKVAPKQAPKKERKRKRKAKEAKPADEPPESAAAPEEKTPRRARSSKVAKAPDESAAEAGTEKTARAKPEGVSWLDQKLDQAQRRFGKHLPDWVFTTGGLVIALGIFGMLIAKPGWFSTLFLIVAAIGLITSAVALLDQVVAVRIFRSFTPIQGLIVSLAIGLVGILLGMIS